MSGFFFLVAVARDVEVGRGDTSMQSSMHMCVQMGADILFHDAKAVGQVWNPRCQDSKM
ncbi:hypothetical protein COCC4DRAFT_30698 [Bipolaris maydis ATCC 48331]|uniref:Uncharacterized protein n=2 Tax=Cochliobolus heterostrophus TaxID=5016 RepID=M2UX61_COCH5|nr:uncharacterized protein COCC4DRAFT_30698 [Bipolaris maydis ATCC 48331]EMD92403.1 hypothetical protein COCHEDRAFT_1021199 [Bipolaris maydis C5]KAJ5022236.1 hypothetical protein J3E73DRAFT_345768 [Bipolaris maydis]ENI08094.1 hypothetical protein COCC4DRAFT_30698 [Bipolaris maydis ATCC 48331]KAJ6272266.1 hypothetical protein PSV08DRAFT_289168 [Bipolaris maydis]KAJ6281642.1 hypothetical protein J3E71DRAFT_291475 [Bipolaris maydis]